MICPHCKKRINRKQMIVDMCKNQEYSLNRLARDLMVQPSSLAPKIKALEMEGKIKVNRFGRGSKISINTIKRELK